MAAGKYNFIVEQGASHVLTFTYTDDLDVPIDLTNKRVRMAVKDHISDTGFVYRASTSTASDAEHLEHFTLLPQNGGTIGQFKIIIPATTTNTFAFNQGVYDLEIVNGTDVTRLLEGKFKVKLQVSV